MKLAALLKRLFAFGMAAWMITLLGAPAGAVPNDDRPLPAPGELLQVVQVVVVEAEEPVRVACPVVPPAQVNRAGLPASWHLECRRLPLEPAT